jgi:transposase
MRRPMPMEPVPSETARVAQAVFPKGHQDLRLADALDAWCTDDALLALLPTHGQPAQPPWPLALVTILPCAEGRSDRQAAHAVRRRIEGTYVLRLELTAPGFDASVLSELRGRLRAGSAASLLLFDRLLTWGRDRHLVKAKGRQRTDSTPMLASVRALMPSTARLLGPSSTRPVQPASPVSAGRPPWITAAIPSSRCSVQPRTVGQAPSERDVCALSSATRGGRSPSGPSRNSKPYKPHDSAKRRRCFRRSMRAVLGLKAPSHAACGARACDAPATGASRGSIWDTSSRRWGGMCYGWASGSWRPRVPRPASRRSPG